MDAATRRKHALNFLNNGRQNRQPRSEEFTAYGQACIEIAQRVIGLLHSHEVRIFASVIPRNAKAVSMPQGYLRKDIVFLLERYFYFLEERRETGLLVMDGAEKQAESPASQQSST